VFYLKEHLIVNEGEEIKGSFSLKTNANNERDLDIVIKYSFEGASETGIITDTLDYKMC